MPTESKPKPKSNKWIEHVKEYAKTHSIKYSEAIKDPACKASYVK